MTVITHMTANGGLAHSGGGRGDERWSEFEYILKELLTSFTDGPHVGCERKKRIKTDFKFPP